MADSEPLSAHAWLTFWRDNVSQSYKEATAHSSLVNFVAPILTTILAVLGVSLFTTNRWVTVIGVGIGPVVWLVILALFVTPARMRQVASRTGLNSPERRLNAEQTRDIIRSAHADLTRLKAEFLAAGWSEEDSNEPFVIQLIAMGSEVETLSDRSDLAKAFAGGGFKVLVDECPAGAPEFDELIGAISIVQERAENVIRPIVINALRAAGIATRDAPHAPHYPHRRHLYDRFATTLVVGQRR